MPSANPDGFSGPDEFAEVLLTARGDCQRERRLFGDISDEGVRRLVRVAYYASQAPNEGRFPRLTFFVPARDEELNLLARLGDELTLPVLRRLGPALASEDCAVVVGEQDGALRLAGIAVFRGSLTKLSLGDRISQPLGRPDGLSVQITGPGELRGGERKRHVLQAGRIRQEISFSEEDWFEEWYEEAARALFPQWMPGSSVAESGYPLPPGLAVAAVWFHLLTKSAELRQGGCFVLLPEPATAPIRPAFVPAGCDLGIILAEFYNSVRRSRSIHSPEMSPGGVRNRLLLRDRLLSAVEVIATLSATDGCVVFNRRLQLHSFGSMIEVAGGGDESVRCFDTTCTPLHEAQLRGFGARRRSAVQLCRACPGALAFVISQDGDLRVFARCGDAVWLYDDAAYW